MTAPPHKTDQHRFAEAADAFRVYFENLRTLFIERESIFTQLELALLSQEHVLIIGPPGTGKSAIADAMLGGLVDETGRPSLFAKQLAESTVQADLIGPVDFKVLTETGRTEHLTDEGMLGASYAFLDEIFDGRDMLLRSILNVLYERELKHGSRITVGRCRTAVMTSNRYLSEVLRRSPETLQAFADRISFIGFVPKSFARQSSRAHMLAQAQRAQRPRLVARLTFAQLEVLQHAVVSVEVPRLVAEAVEALGDGIERLLASEASKTPEYVPTKYFSQRTAVKALWALKAAVVRDRLYRRADRPLVATLDDLPALESFFVLAGPRGEELTLLGSRAADARERTQLEVVRIEQRAFAAALGEVRERLARSPALELKELDIEVLQRQAREQTTRWSSLEAATLAAKLHRHLVPGPRHEEHRPLLLRAAQSLTGVLETRLQHPPDSQESDRPAQVAAILAVLELTRGVPELREHAASLGQSIAAFAHQSAGMIALGADAATFDESLGLEQLAQKAKGLSSDADAIMQLAQSMSVQHLRTALTDSKREAAKTLRRLVERRLSTGASAQLGVEGRRLAAVEQSLVQLDSSHTGLRQALLLPSAVVTVRTAITSPALKLAALELHVRAAVDELRAEGLEPSQVSEAIRQQLIDRIGQIVAELKPRADVTPPSTGTVLSGEAYGTYRQALGTTTLDGELRALRELERLCGAIVPSNMVDAVTSAELSSLEARVEYLETWMIRLTEALPRPPVKRQAADEAFAMLIHSRFPLLATRDGELLRLATSFDAFAVEEGSKAQRAQRAGGRVAALGLQLRELTEALLAARQP